MYDKNFAEFYNKLFSEEKYIKEIDLFRPFFKGNRCLDLGCGTGRHIELISGDFKEVYGLDPSLNMLRICRENMAKKMINNVVLYNSFNQIDSGLKFSTIISLFNVVNHILNYEDLVNYFRNSYNFLESSGLFLFDCWNYKSLDGLEQFFYREYPLNDGFSCFENSHIDFNNNLNKIDYTIFKYSNGQKITVTSFHLVQKIWTFDEIESALNDANIFEFQMYDRDTMKPFTSSSISKRLVYFVNI